MKINVTSKEKKVINEILNLSRHDFDFMNGLNIVSYDDFHQLLNIKRMGNDFYVEANNDSIAKLRTIFEEYFSIAASFDVNDEITPKGKLIENLIDKFYVG